MFEWSLEHQSEDILEGPPVPAPKAGCEKRQSRGRPGEFALVETLRGTHRKLPLKSHFQTNFLIWWLANPFEITLQRAIRAASHPPFSHDLLEGWPTALADLAPLPGQEVGPGPGATVWLTFHLGGLRVASWGQEGSAWLGVRAYWAVTPF